MKLQHQAAPPVPSPPSGKDERENDENSWLVPKGQPEISQPQGGWYGDKYKDRAGGTVEIHESNDCAGGSTVPPGRTHQGWTIPGTPCLANFQRRFATPSAADTRRNFKP
jgi:hypothetical protein